MAATSTKDDLIVYTACALRPERPVYVFDPTGCSESPAPWPAIRPPGARRSQVAIYVLAHSSRRR
jgi:hypothetical protein